MTIDEAIDNVTALISVFDNEMMKISEELATNAQTLIIHRIQTKGIGKQYSTKKVPAYLYLIDDSRLDTEQTRTAIKKKAEDGEMVNWADVREAHGNQVQFVDLTFTGRMFQNLGIITTQKVGNSYVTTIAGFDAETRQKMEWNFKRYGDFFASSTDEIAILEKLFDKRVVELHKKYL